MSPASLRSSPISSCAIPSSLARVAERLFSSDSRQTDGPVESLVPALHARAKSLTDQLRTRYPNVKLELTGEIPLNFDIRKASADDVRRGETLVIPATLALLLLAFGSLVAAMIPLAVGQLAIATTLAIAGFLGQRWHLSILVQNLATMLGLGLGIDYSLLMVNRFRKPSPPGTTALRPQLSRHGRQAAPSWSQRQPSPSASSPS